MRIKSIELQNFRNIASLSLQAAPDVNVIHGENAQGKTNLTEAIWMFTGAKSFRGAKDREMIRFGEDHCRTDLVFQSALREETASIELNQPDARGEKRAKTVCLNEVPLNSAAELAGQFYAVVFSPAHLSLVREGPALRRKFLDTAIGQIMPRYGHYLHEYQRTLLQRNTLLKDAERHPQLLETMEIWEENLARAAAAVAFCRARYVERIRPLAAQVYEGISSGREQFDLHYLCGVNEPHSCTRDQLRSYYQQQLYREREEDMIRGCHPVRSAPGRPGAAGQRDAHASVRLPGTAAQRGAGFKDGRVQHGRGGHQRGSCGAAGRCYERTGCRQAGLSAQPPGQPAGLRHLLR